MVVSNPSLTWERLNNVFYRLRTCYNLTWADEVNFQDYNVALAPYSTAIALYPKPLESAPDQPFYNALLFNQSHVKEFSIYSGAGEKLYQIKWDESKNGKVVGFDWSLEEHFIVVLDTGIFRNYYDFEDNFHESSLGHRAESVGIADVRFYRTGFVARLLDNTFLHVGDYINPHPRLFPQRLPEQDAADPSSIDTWAIIPPTRSMSKSAEILISQNTTFYSLDDMSLQDKGVTQGPFKHIAVAPSGNLVALYSARTRKVYITTADTYLVVHEVRLEGVAGSMGWCSDDVLAIVLDDELKVVGPGEGCLSFYYNGQVDLFTETDGVWVLSDDKLEFLSRVPPVTVDVFKIGTTAAASILLDSVDLKGSSDPTDVITALENIAIIEDELESAVGACIEVATGEFDQYWQKKLLLAAAFAKTHVKHYNSEQLVEVTRTLRVLNQLRSHTVGMFFTYDQFAQTEVTHVVSLLLKRKQHVLSIKLSGYLGLPLDAVYIDWCGSKIKQSSDMADTDLFQQVRGKLTQIRNVSYENVSRIAYQEGRSSLAIMLIDCEPIASRKIPLLLEMDEDALAIAHAEHTMDSKLIEWVILLLQSKLSLSEFLKTLNNKHTALCCWENLMKALNNWYFLKNYYLSFDRKLSLANLTLLLALIGKSEQDLIETPTLAETKLISVVVPWNATLINNTNQNTNQNTNSDLTELMASFANKRRLLLASIQSYSDIKSKDILDDIRYLQQELRLVETQESLQKLYSNVRFYGHSIIGTLRILISINNYNHTSETSEITKKINRFLKDFKISDKRYYLLAIDQLSSTKSWNLLYRFATSRKSPIGYAPFYKVCLRHNALREASMYIDLVDGRKTSMYLRVGNYKRAGEEAFKNKDLAKLKQILVLYNRTSHPNSAVVQLIEEYIRKLS